jgi:sulfate adenylyltransferase small subunit
MDNKTIKHLKELEAESIYVLREVAAQFERPVILFSGGKDSIVITYLAYKAFYPAKIPFPLLHIDTGHNFEETIQYRDELAKKLGAELIVGSVQESIDKGRVKEETGYYASRNKLQTTTLLDTLEEYKFDAAIGGARRDEEKARAKERFFSHRDEFGQWNPKNQRPELWNIFNGRKNMGEHFRVFPISNWTEMDVWQYIFLEDIPMPSLYFTHEREVFNKDGSFLAVLYTDFHPRAGKRSGAWMTSYKEQWIENGVNSRPHVSVTMNFTKPSAGKPALLTFSEVNTFLHEFGHALHGMFANTTYSTMSGTSVYWDFVELPSQIMENFATEKEFLNTFARHYQTGEPIPAELIQKIVDASNFNVAYACLRQVSFGLLDMAWYTRRETFDGDVRAYEKEAWKKAQVLPGVEDTCMSVQFSHIMAGGYSAGYYSYKWAEVLDADAFSLFKEKGIFNQEVAASFRENILSKGGTEHPMTLYKRFRGQEPSIHALLKRNGIIN